ncbi:S-adenosyl-L-methionine-dependent methyltransferase [Mycena metata]|uniref:S-adenosyl-L-methionine-dependent methyltransferase n=1 Tax=Mycena metata TaxID=1033252 RepID=A0AAD7M9H5_9AGAR|nr:S-adenosyl-L-methionine-dependent methyltransferase [Mycena metata]
MPPEDHSAYGLTAASASEEEKQRLDQMHATFTRYFNRALSLTPITSRPKKILDLGCGSGAWAIQAASEFPDANIVAVDISPLPQRQLPPNVHFVLADLNKEWNFENDAFDLVHSRLVMAHLINGKGAILRASHLVKPGGFMVLEDLDLNSMVQTGGPATLSFVSKIIEVWASRKSDAEMGRKFSAFLNATGCFSDIQAREVAAPFCGTDPDEAVNQFGQGIKDAWIKVSEDPRLRAFGFTEPMVQQQKEELTRADCKTVLNVHFCWAQRKNEGVQP